MIPDQTVFEQVDALMDALLGPPSYRGVRLLSRASEHCADVALIESTKPEGTAFCEGYADACRFLMRHADSLDAYLVADYTEDANA